MYVCGITPYDATHLGHAATYLAFDLVNRVWRDTGHAVHYVQNVTDIDDPLLERADRDSEDWIVLGMRETALFREDMTALRVLPPEDYVGAVESIPRIVAHIEALLGRHRYGSPTVPAAPDLRVAQAPGFGAVGYDEATCCTSSPSVGETPTGRASAAAGSDAVARRARRGSRGGPAGPARGGPGGTSSAPPSRWTPSAWLRPPGRWQRPRLPAPRVLRRPRRGAARHRAFARRLRHAAMIGLDGEKMSKSRGNLVFVSKLRGEGVDPMAIRLALLAEHHRTDRDVDERSPAARPSERLATWRRRSGEAGPAPAAPSREIRGRLSDDLDSPAGARGRGPVGNQPVPGRRGWEEGPGRARACSTGPSTRCSACGSEPSGIPPRRPDPRGESDVDH